MGSDFEKQPRFESKEEFVTIIRLQPRGGIPWPHFHVTINHQKDFPQVCKQELQIRNYCNLKVEDSIMSPVRQFLLSVSTPLPTPLGNKVSALGLFNRD